MLSTNPFEDDKLREECGIFGVWGAESATAVVALGLHALQHRGQESAGIAASDGERILIYKDMGLVSQVFTETDLASLTGDLAIGHCRYSTTGSSTWVNAQPTLRPTKYGTLALAHNGNLTNTGDLAEMVQKLESSFFTNPVDPFQFIFKGSLASYFPVKGDAVPVYFITNTSDEF
mgnify:CR=1 FL=1